MGFMSSSDEKIKAPNVSFSFISQILPELYFLTGARQREKERERREQKRREGNKERGEESRRRMEKRERNRKLVAGTAEGPHTLASLPQAKSYPPVLVPRSLPEQRVFSCRQDGHHSRPCTALRG